MIETSKGPARFLEFPAKRPRATLVLGHGAGGGGTAPDLAAIALVIAPMPPRAKPQAPIEPSTSPM